MCGNLQPFTNLSDIVRGLGDPRIRIWEERVGEAYTAKLPDGSWNPQYHDDLYLMTDQAIKGVMISVMTACVM